MAIEKIQDIAIRQCALMDEQSEDCLDLSFAAYEYQSTYFKSLVSFNRFKYLAIDSQINLLLYPTDSLVREVYNELITKIYENEFKEKFKEEHEHGKTLSQSMIKEAINARNNTKVALQSLTSTVGQIGIYLRNYYKYGSIYGAYTKFSFICDSGYLCYEPSFTIKVDGTTLLKEIDAYKAFKTDGSDLGLKGNQFGEKIEIAKQFNQRCYLGKSIYPENISEEYMKCYQAYQSAGACHDIYLKPSKVECPIIMTYRGMPIERDDL